MKKILEASVVKSIIPILRAFPLSFARNIGSGLGVILRDVVGVRREVIKSNISRALPELEDREVQEIADHIYPFFSRAAVDWLRYDEVRQHETIRVLGWEHARELTGKGGIIASAHLGYWELAASELANRFGGFTVYVDRQSNPYTEQIIENLRRERGIETVSGSNGLRELVRRVEAGEIVGIMGDQRPRNQHEYVKFFHDVVKNTRTLSFVARHTQAPVVPVVMVRSGEREITMNVASPLTTSMQEVTEDNRSDLLREYNEWLEDQIREYPAQYFWAHKRWKGAR